MCRASGGLKLWFYMKNEDLGLPPKKFEDAKLLEEDKSNATNDGRVVGSDQLPEKQ